MQDHQHPSPVVRRFIGGMALMIVGLALLILSPLPTVNGLTAIGLLAFWVGLLLVLPTT